MDAINTQPRVEQCISFAGIFEDDETAVGSVDGDIETMAALPDLLRPTQPPPSAKDRVMAHLQEPIVAIFVPPVKSQNGSV